MAASASAVAQIRRVASTDLDDWLRLRHAMWPHDVLADHRSAIERFFAGHRHEPMEVLLAIDGNGAVVGFAEVSIRNIVDSCATDRVGYLEGWYVEPEARRQGVGRALVLAAERWAVEQGCTEFGSDARSDNEVSRVAHLALGFEETGCVRNFRKDLPQRNASI
jgi:aminoglycoside 6'-N-acetyltransferase I